MAGMNPKVFNETAWNLGLPVRWKDYNRNGKIDNAEVIATGIDAKTLASMLKVIQDGAAGTHLKEVRTVEYIQGLDRKLAAAKAALAKKPDDKDLQDVVRQAYRDRDMGSRGWAEHTIDFSALSLGEQKAAWIMVNEVLPAIERIHMVQQDPNNLKYLQEIAATGNFRDYLHAWYSGGPWCQEISDKQCSSHVGLPERVPNAGMWPASYTDKEVAAVAKRSDSDADKKNLLSNFVERYLDGATLKWRPVNANPALKPHLAELSKALLHAAAVEGIDPTLKLFLKQRAAELKDTTKSFPYFDGDLAWINVKGALDVTFGFYEVDDSPHELNALMQGYVGPVDGRRETLGRRFQQLAPLMEAEISRDLGASYKPRVFKGDLPPLRFADLIGAGDNRIKYVAAGYYLPNVEPYGDGSKYRKVFITNNIAARMAGVLKPMAQLVMDPSQQQVVADDMGNFTVAHENAHGVGIPTGQLQLGKFNGSLEEAKADQEGIASLPTAVKQGLLTQAEADRACIVMVTSLLRGLSYGMSDPHGVGSILEFSELYREGGIVETADGRYKVNFENGAIYKASTRLARKLEALQNKSLTKSEEAQKEAVDWLAASKAALPNRLVEVYLPQLQKMPKDVYPWYHVQFSESVVNEMGGAYMMARK